MPSSFVIICRLAKSEIEKLSSLLKKMNNIKAFSIIG